ASGAPLRPTGSPQDSSTLAQSFDVNAIDPKFKWPQVWTTDFAVDHQLPGGLLGTLEVVYAKDVHAIFMRNADLRTPLRNLPGPDGRKFYGGCVFKPADCPVGSGAGGSELTPNFGAGIYVLDNTSEGHSINVTAQLRKNFASGLSTSLAYGFTDARNNLKSTEIASVLWQNEPVKGDPNKPELSYSEFGQRHRIIGAATYTKTWSSSLKTRIGVFVEVAQGNRFAGAGGNRYSVIYSGGGQRHGFELSLDILNVGHLLNSSWGVRKVASAAATSPLKLVRFDATGAPVFNFTGPSQTFIDDASLLSRWQMQIGLRYLLN